MSIGAFLLRIVESRNQRYTVYGTLLVVGVFSIIYLFLAIFQCHPINHYVSLIIIPKQTLYAYSISVQWNFSVSGTCFPTNVVVGMTYAQTVISCTCDFIFAGVPVVLVSFLLSGFPIIILLVEIPILVFTSAVQVTLNVK